MIDIPDITTRTFSASSSSFYSSVFPTNTDSPFTGGTASSNDTVAYSSIELIRWRTTTTASDYISPATTTTSYSTYEDYDTDFNIITLTLTSSSYTTSTNSSSGRTTATTSATTTASTITSATTVTTSVLAFETYSAGISGASDVTAYLYYAESGKDLLVFTGTGPVAITDGSRVTSSKATRTTIASSAWAGGAPGTTFTQFTTTGDTHLSDTNRGFNAVFDYSTQTTTQFLGGYLPPPSQSGTFQLGKTQTTVTSNSGTNTGIWNFYQTRTSTVSYTDFTTTLHRSGTGTGTHYETAFTVRRSTSTYVTSADWAGTSEETSTYASGLGPPSFASGTNTFRTLKTTVETLVVFEPWPLTSAYNGNTTPNINYKWTESYGWNPVSTEFSAAPVGNGITAAAVHTLIGFPDWQAAVSVDAPAPYLRRTTFRISKTNTAVTTYATATVRFGTDSVVSSTWTVTTASSTDPNTSSGTMSLATSGAAQTYTTTRNTDRLSTIGTVDAVIPAGLLIASHDSGESVTFYSAPTHYQNTFTVPVILQCVERVQGPCILEIPKYSSTSTTAGLP